MAPPSEAVPRPTPPAPPAATGRRVESREHASSAIRRLLPELWRGMWKLRMRILAECALQRNPLIQRRQAWAVECAGAPDLPFVLYVLTQGAPVCEPHNRPSPTLLTSPAQWAKVNHQSVLEPKARAQVHKILSEEVEAGILVRVREGDGQGVSMDDLASWGFFVVHTPDGCGAQDGGHQASWDQGDPELCVSAVECG